MTDAAEIRTCVENWVVWRDAGDWDRFATVWHSDGWMTATWFQGPASRFIEVSREGFDRGVNILHALNGWSCDIAGSRAISQAKMNIFQRARSMACSSTSPAGAGSHDFFERRDGRWAIVRRQPIYEKDRLDPVDPSVTLSSMTIASGNFRKACHRQRHGRIDWIEANPSRRSAGDERIATGRHAVRRNRRTAPAGDVDEHAIEPRTLERCSSSPARLRASLRCRTTSRSAHAGC